MNDILDIIESRRSIRKFKNQMIEPQLLEKVLKAGTFAPSGKNRQASIILAITNKEVRDRLSRICATLRGLDENSDPFYGAPVVCVVLASKDVPTYIYDGSVVMENMLLEAHSLGLGGCWIHHCKQIFETEYGKQLLQDLGITGEYEGIGNCILGYPDDAPDSPHIKENYVYYIN